jgi:hypothetical protein
MLDGRSTVSGKGSYFPFRPEVQGVSEAHPVAYTVDSQLKNSPQCEADHWFSSNAKFKNVRNHVATSPLHHKCLKHSA